MTNIGNKVAQVADGVDKSVNRVKAMSWQLSVLQGTVGSRVYNSVKKPQNARAAFRNMRDD